jgi:hypothetical protein
MALGRSEAASRLAEMQIRTVEEKFRKQQSLESHGITLNILKTPIAMQK